MLKYERGTADVEQREIDRLTMEIDKTRNTLSNIETEFRNQVITN